jgi:hypothetical protein
MALKKGIRFPFEVSNPMLCNTRPEGDGSSLVQSFVVLLCPLPFITSSTFTFSLTLFSLWVGLTLALCIAKWGTGEDREKIEEWEWKSQVQVWAQVRTGKPTTMQNLHDVVLAVQNGMASGEGLDKDVIHEARNVCTKQELFHSQSAFIYLNPNIVRYLRK